MATKKIRAKTPMKNHPCFWRKNGLGRPNKGSMEFMQSVMGKQMNPLLKSMFIRAGIEMKENLTPIKEIVTMGVEAEKHQSVETVEFTEKLYDEGAQA